MSGETMRAVLLKEPGGPESLDVEQVAIPEPHAGEALVRVHAAALTRDELEWPLDRCPRSPRTSCRVSSSRSARAPTG